MKNDGRQLERDFARWMQDELGYQSVKQRERVQGATARRDYEVDIHGTIRRDLQHRLVQASVILAAAAFPLEFVGAIPPNSAYAAAAVFAFLAWLLYSKATTQAWVECKDLRGNFTRAHVQKTIESVRDFMAAEDARWEPNLVILVSGSDFDVDALSFARKYSEEHRIEIECYRRSPRGFQQLD